MPRTVLDSSVLVSAFVTPQGQVAQLLRQPVRGRYRLCLSDIILAETAETLLKKPTLRRSYAGTVNLVEPVGASRRDGPGPRPRRGARPARGSVAGAPVPSPHPPGPSRARHDAGGDGARGY